MKPEERSMGIGQGHSTLELTREPVTAQVFRLKAED